MDDSTSNLVHQIRNCSTRQLPTPVSEARGDFESAGDETGLDSVNSDAREDEVFVEGGVIAGSEGRNRVES